MREERWIAYVEKIGKVTEEIQEKLQDRKRKGLLAKKISGTDFEEVVYDCLLEAGFEKENITHSTQKFPDFIVEDIQSGKKIGIEVKKTDSKKWEVIGGSIYESLKNDIDDTYIIMAKMGGDNPEVRFRKYEECIADLKVTHSPRFYLDMDLEKGRDYLSQNGKRYCLPAGSLYRQKRNGPLCSSSHIILRRNCASDYCQQRLFTVYEARQEIS